jgi:hypothetical protein
LTQIFHCIIVSLFFDVVPLCTFRFLFFLFSRK